MKTVAQRSIFTKGMFLLLLVAVVIAAATVLFTGVARVDAAVTTGVNPESGAETCPVGYGLEDFESGTDGFKGGGGPIASTISGVHFVTTEGQDWLTGDWTYGYNGKYPNGAYTSGGQKWAWLGTSQGSGIIDFTQGPASYVSIYASTYSGVYLEAFADDDTLLESAGIPGSNLNTGTMAHLSISRNAADISYVTVHDSGNFFLIDWLCTDAPGVTPPARALGITVSVDIKPGDESNSINISKKQGVTAVAILTTENFDAATVVIAAVGFGPNGAGAQHDGHIEDVDGDGDEDLVLHFPTQDTGIQHGDTEACVTGQTLGGVPFYGCDTVKTVGK